MPFALRQRVGELAQQDYPLRKVERRSEAAENVNPLVAGQLLEQQLQLW